MTDTPTLTQSIGQAENALRAILDRLLAKTGISYAQWVTLNLIAHGESTVPQDQLVRQLSGGLKLDESRVLATLGELATQGLVTTPPGDPARVMLTMAGDAQFDLLRQNIDRVIAGLYSDVPVDELAATRRVLAIVTERANNELRKRGF